MPIPAYRAKQSTDTAGTGTVVLNAAATNARSFNAAFGASARRVMYAISWATGFELGLGDFDGGSPGSLTRATVLASSNAGALVSLPAGTKDVFAVFDPAAREVISISATATLALADLGNAVVFSGSSAASLNLPAVATAPLGAGWLVMNTGTAALTIDPSGAETVNGAATLILQAGASALLARNGAAWSAVVMIGPNVTGDFSISGVLSVSGAIRMAAGTAALPAITPNGDPDTGIFSPGADQLAVSVGGDRLVDFLRSTVLASNKAGDSDLFFYGRAVDASAVNGRVINWTSLNENSIPVAALRYLILTDGSSGVEISATPAGARSSNRQVVRMYVPGSGPITVNGGMDVAGGLQFDGKLVGIQRGTEQATTSGTAIDFTSIPAGVRRVTLLLNAVSAAGNAKSLRLRIGPSSGVETTGYLSGAQSSAATDSFELTQGSDWGDSGTGSGSGIVTLMRGAGDKWFLNSILHNPQIARVHSAAGRKVITGELTNLRFYWADNTAFDGGAITPTWEF